MADVGSGDAGREQSSESGSSPTAPPGGGSAVKRLIVSSTKYPSPKMLQHYNYPLVR